MSRHAFPDISEKSNRYFLHMQRVAIIQHRLRLPSTDDDASGSIEALFREDGTEALLRASVGQITRRSGDGVKLRLRQNEGEHTIEGSDLLVGN